MVLKLDEVRNAFIFTTLRKIKPYYYEGKLGKWIVVTRWHLDDAEELYKHFKGEGHIKPLNLTGIRHTFPDSVSWRSKDLGCLYTEDIKYWGYFFITSQEPKNPPPGFRHLRWIKNVRIL